MGDEDGVGWIGNLTVIFDWKAHVPKGNLSHMTVKLHTVNRAYCLSAREELTDHGSKECSTGTNTVYTDELRQYAPHGFTHWRVTVHVI
ncbi:hypothetical protein F383_23099 [Gossypium arboreum]|uniref:Uncharacterized protein n=1 Tax=Gossypium arboreum TaxID=29729 RepID=A0A0B0P0V6_GOSAR|nr:hypothetical protein F383_23099 [Gossypium arboreum]